MQFACLSHSFTPFLTQVNTNYLFSNAHEKSNNMNNNDVAQ